MGFRGLNRGRFAVVAFVWGALIALQVLAAPARAAESDEPLTGYDALREGILTVAQTRFPQVNLDADGRFRIERRFDEDGRLAMFTIIDERSDPSWSQVTAVSYEPAFHVVEIRQAGRLVLHETRFFDPGAERLTKVLRYHASPEGAGWARRELANVEGAQERTRMFQLRRGAAAGTLGEQAGSGGSARPPVFPPESAWEPFGAVEVRDHFHATDPPQLQQGLDQYLSCLRTRATGAGRSFDEAACRARLNALLTSTRATTEFHRYTASLSCRDDQSLHLPNGFRINLASCQPAGGSAADQRRAQEAVQSLVRATNRVMEEMVGCLADFNPTAAARYVSSIQTLRPEIQCGGEASRRDLVATRVCGTGAACRRQLLTGDYGQGHAGFGGEGEPSFHLDAGDPLIYDKYRNDASTIRRDTITASTLDERIALRKSHSNNGGTLAGLIFHETMHNSRFPSPNGSQHNVTNASDTVYGCHSLCGGSQRLVYQESCLTCAGAFGNRPSAEVQAACRGRYSPRAAILKYGDALRILDSQKACAAGNAPACASIRTRVPSCASPAEAACREALKEVARQLVTDAQNLSGGGNSYPLWEPELNRALGE
ncbi:MAG: hypothetical protein IT285_15555 [Bdellovibrionales bacterium]|nr:hypothetical protein [Bdellovibrionales bacterium]